MTRQRGGGGARETFLFMSLPGSHLAAADPEQQVVAQNFSPTTLCPSAGEFVVVVVVVVVFAEVCVWLIPRGDQPKSSPRGQCPESAERVTAIGLPNGWTTGVIWKSQV